MKDDTIYDHFSNTWRNPITWQAIKPSVLPHVKRRCKDIALGIVSIVCMAVMSLATIILIWR
jgi:hypothetical protein